MTSRSSVWVVTLSYPDAGLDMTSMDAWEVALCGLEASVSRVPAAGIVDVRLHVASSSAKQAVAAAVARSSDVIGLDPLAVTVSRESRAARWT